MKITAHTICKNEATFIWYAVTSVIDYVDEHLIWDTESTDDTPEIVKALAKKYPKKIKTRFLKNYDVSQFTPARQSMIDESTGDWILIADADEVWWDDHIDNVTGFIRSKGGAYETIYNRCINLVGDVFHKQPESAGRYSIDGIKGHLNVRAMNRSIPGFCVKRPHGTQAFFDGNGKPVYERDRSKRYFYDQYSYLHFTNIVRSTSRDEDRGVPKRNFKYKYELGISLPRDYYFPESFFRHRPEIVSSPWTNRSLSYTSRAALQTPLKNIRRSLNIFHKEGY
ncbi:glycosyltransferase [Patescibacteria group bacterium]